VHVGNALYVDCINEKQIQRELIEKNISISIREIGYLAKKFVVYLALAHRESRASLEDFLRSKGGYILHLDGTCEGDSPHLMTALDEVAEIALSNIKIGSEKASDIVPFLRQIKKDYGPPIALSHDMGTGILSAVREVFPNTPDFICHFHFLRDIGNDLFSLEYSKIRNALKKEKIRPSLRKIIKQRKEEMETREELMACIENYAESSDTLFITDPGVWSYIQIRWIMDANSECDGYGFPFDRPHLSFYGRIRKVKMCIGILPSKLRNNPQVAELNRILTPLCQDKTLDAIFTRLSRKVELFDNLRNAMRIAAPNDKNGLNDDGENVDIKTIKSKVRSFRQSKRVMKAAAKDTSMKRMVKQIDKYWDKLFADPINITTSRGKRTTIQPQRTNNILERFFRDLKRMYRRKSGTVSVSQALKSMIVDTPLVKNLSNRDYLKIILNGKNTLEERFAEIDASLVRAELKSHTENQKITSPKMKNFLRTPSMPVHITRVLKKAS
jgi:hypothetical protein